MTLLNRSFGFPKSLNALFLFQSDVGIKKFSQYKEAKAGDANAALNLVIELAVAWLYTHRDRFTANLIFVAPHAKEATGDNAIPQTLAADTEIVQTDRVYHTGVDPMAYAMRAQFEGQVIAGAEYVLVDDVVAMGGTLADLANYIQCHCGIVRDAIVLVNAGRSTAFVPEAKFIRLIKERFHDEFEQIFGIAPDALSANEARYVSDFRSADALRNRRAKAEQEIDHRLRSKGIARTSGGV